jgi:hypothetical protein
MEVGASLTDKDSHRGGAHEGADDNGDSIAAVAQGAVGEVVGLGVHKTCRQQQFAGLLHFVSIPAEAHVCYLHRDGTGIVQENGQL